MKKIITIFLCIFYFTSYWYFSDKDQSNFVIWKVVWEEFFMIDQNWYENLNKNEKNKKNYLKLNYNLDKIETLWDVVEKVYWNWFMLKNNFFIDKNWVFGIKINKNIIKKLKDGNWVFKNWDIVVIQVNNLFSYENEIKKILWANILISLWWWNTFSIYEKAYKIKCKKDIFNVLEIDWWIDNLSKNKLQNNLQKEIKTCSNFNKLFNITYKDKKDYKIRLDYFKKYIEKKYSKIIKKITWNKKSKILEKIEEIRQEKNNDKKISEEKKKILIFC